ncbi:hypothetical protein GA0115252_14076 [Streptomyces sp. DfronAA-171]|nr:hypothetical protein GA0115252_14076 [Streptomyces sp. DfronAA-171]
MGAGWTGRRNGTGGARAARHTHAAPYPRSSPLQPPTSARAAVTTVSRRRARSTSPPAAPSAAPPSVVPKGEPLRVSRTRRSRRDSGGSVLGTVPARWAAAMRAALSRCAFTTTSGTGDSGRSSPRQAARRTAAGCASW